MLTLFLVLYLNPPPPLFHPDYRACLQQILCHKVEHPADLEQVDPMLFKSLIYLEDNEVDDLMMTYSTSVTDYQNRPVEVAVRDGIVGFTSRQPRSTLSGS